MRSKKIINLYFILLIFILCSCKSKIDFAATWINENYPCDSIRISKSGKSYVVEKDGKQYPAKVSDDILEIYFGFLPTMAIIDDGDKLILSEDNFVRSETLLEGQYLQGNWNVFENDSLYNGSMKFIGNQVEIYYAMPIEIYGSLLKTGKNSYDIYYCGAAGSISMNEIIESNEPYVNRISPIASIRLTPDDHIRLKWYGIYLQGERWLSKLDEELLWASPKKNNGSYEVILKRNDKGN